MKEAIHPGYKAAKVTCACGNVIETRSTRDDFHIEICSQCHPFFTGKQKIMDTAGRIEKFKNRYGATPVTSPAPKKAEAKAAEPSKKAEAPKENRAAKRAKATKAKPKTEAAPAEPAAEAKSE